MAAKKPPAKPPRRPGPASRSTAAAPPLPKGTHGGRRAGAGRPRSAINETMRAAIGPVPLDDPLGQARWYQRTIAVLTDAILEGKPFRELLEIVRASAGAAAKILPLDVIHEAGRRLDRDERDLREAEADADVVERRTDRVAQRARAVRRDPT